MPNQMIHVRPKSAPLWDRAKQRAAERHMSLSEVVAAALRLWLKHDAEYYGGPGPEGV